MNSAKIGLVVLLVVLVALCGLLFLQGGRRGEPVERLVLHCAAGMRAPVAEIVENYEKEFGTKINVSYDGSGSLASKIKVAGGDLYLPADISYIDSLRDEGYVDESIPVAELTAGIAVRRGNPQNIKTLADLQRADVKVSLGESSAAIGKLTQKVLSDLGQWEAIKRNVTVFKPTVNNVAEDVELSAVDAGIVWDSMIHLYENVEFISVHEFEQHRRRATIGVLSSTIDATAALQFARYLTAEDRGLQIFRNHGFNVVDGDKWERVPEITFFSGSMLRPAINDQLEEFQNREGVRINVVFEGCGTLVSQMEAGARPDGYFSCDARFLDMVRDRFEPPSIVTRNDVVLLVPKGNPDNFQSLQDLSRPDVRVGVAHPEKSALGFLTRSMLERLELWEPIEQAGNIVVLASKGDELVNQMQVGSLDAAILYRSNAMASPQIMEHCEIIEMNGTDAFAEQLYAVSRNSDHRQLMHRLQESLTGPAGKQAFLKYGFHWQLNDE